MIPTSLRVRDLVHGYVHLTGLEEGVIDHPLFQRLRHVRQNDVAFYVYPSLNISRFEHSLGCAHVAGRMAHALTQSSGWRLFKKDAKVTKEKFQQICRLYALLHDVGHLPLSHLFELAFEEYARVKWPKKTFEVLTKSWFGGSGFKKLHEACGSAVATRIVNDIGIDDDVAGPVLKLMSSKKTVPSDPFAVVKLLVDSEIDADRIDSTARDGLLAGREFGNYDADRLCSSVALQKHSDRWRIAYSEKALGSIEAILLDRYRTHTWIHFHHRVAAMKVVALELIRRLLQQGKISKRSFRVSRPKEMLLRDDVWLWRLLRENKTNDKTGKAATLALFERGKKGTTLIWKNRTEYNRLHNELRKRSGRRDIGRFSREYQDWIREKLRVQAFVFWLKFKPVGNDAVPLITDAGKPAGDLIDVSHLVRSLSDVWAEEPQYYVVLIGDTAKDRSAIQEKWVEATYKWLVR